MKGENRKFTFEEIEYDGYTATQKQRQIERTVRKLKREQAAFKAAGLTEDAQAVTVRIRRLTDEYRAFSKAAGLPMQWERMRAYESIKQTENTAVAVSPKPAIIRHKEASSGGGVVHTIGKIDISKYSLAAGQPIRAETVVLTGNQREHIIKRRGQEFFDKYSAYFQKIAEDPDYIFKDKLHDNTAIACKTITEGGKNVHLVIRLAVVGDEPGLENSIITAIIEGDKRYKQRIRNNIPLYKKE